MEVFQGVSSIKNKIMFHSKPYISESPEITLIQNHVVDSLRKIQIKNAEVY